MQILQIEFSLMNSNYFRHRSIQIFMCIFPKCLIRIFPRDFRRHIKNFILKSPTSHSYSLPQRADRQLPQLSSPSFPSSWRPKIAWWLNREKTQDTCFVIHVYYSHLLEELILEVSKNKFDFDLIITNSSGSSLEEDHVLELLQTSRVCDILILDTPNRGRDILPLVYCVNADLLNPYDYIFKLHTKKSEWVKDRSDIGEGKGGGYWRKSFLEDLLGNGANSLILFENLKHDSDLGVITSNNSLLGSEYWTTNLSRTRELALRIELDFLPEDLIFPAGSMYACKALIIQGLRSLCLNEDDFEVESGQIDGTTAHAVERLIGLVAIAGGYSQRTTIDLSLPVVNKVSTAHNKKVNFVAYYLPQFHRDPINDLNWGMNFTEWNNVTRALPQFSNHMQPLLPTDLGFYDLESEDTVLAQEKLADSYGVSAFMYYYYNFGNTVALEKPILNRIRRVNGLPFSIIWVNESWGRNWDGLEGNLIAEQLYPEGWETELIDSIAPFLKHPDFLKDSENRPIFSIYRPGGIPNVGSSLKLIREYAKSIGIGELHILFADTQSSFDGEDLSDTTSLADGTHAFPPHGANWKPHLPKLVEIYSKFIGNMYSYSHSQYWKKIENKVSVYHPGVLTRFDNTARRNHQAHIVYGSNPYIFRRTLLEILKLTYVNENSDRFIFINAWNEWAEGAVLEPSNRFGYTYLLALREITRYSTLSA